ncbi:MULTISPECIES: hypothetical protein [Acidianus]|nr:MULTISPECIES: hypothetical protein [Acidianus]NON61784.1 hypothetical protein [Acidianus sp. RZ1]
MEIGKSQDISKKVSSMINSAIESIVVLSGEIGIDLAKEIVRKAASGVNTSIITSDAQLANFLEDYRHNYGQEMLKSLHLEILNLNRKISILARIPFVVLVLSIAALIVTFIRDGYTSLSFIVLILITVPLTIIIFFVTRRMRGKLESETGVKNDNYQRTLEEYKELKENLRKRLHITLVPEKINFSILIADNNSLLTSGKLEIYGGSNNSRNELVLTEEMSKDNALKIISFIVNLNKI